MFTVAIKVLPAKSVLLTTIAQEKCLLKNAQTTHLRLKDQNIKPTVNAMVDFFGDGGGPCEPCPADTYCENGDKSICPLHSASVRLSNNINDCSCIKGYHGADGETCTLCPSDSYCPGGDLIIPCRASSESNKGSFSSDFCICEPGTYADPDEPVDRTCLICVSGVWCHAGNSTQCPSGSTSETGATGEADCSCMAGYGQQTVTSICSLCEPGTYKEQIGALACTECAENM